ncbi:RNA-directed DNA polymerase [Bhargavaea ullalensis]|uniref:Reverse transcriptase domain-containing protein n=1 Tax=Bhargavaea ullalensis TaxID=1265685 RepID=A0ABV2GBI9_9BACL
MNTKIKDSLKKNHNGRMYYVPTEEQAKRYNYVKRELSNKFNLSMANRDEIVKSIISIITHGDRLKYKIPEIDLVVYRTDIENFFPSINKHQLYRKLMNANVLSVNSIDIIKEIIFSKEIKGIPLGLQFSNHLAELYLEDVDREIKHSLQPLMYYRYVDDIFLLFYDLAKSEGERIKEKDRLIAELDRILKIRGLKRNQGKTTVSYFNNSTTNKKELSFEFLGYTFKSDNQNLKIGIADEKVKKIIKGIKVLFNKYNYGAKSKSDFWKLYYKLKNIIFGVTSYDKKGQRFKYGLGYNYRYINSEQGIKEILETIKPLIFSCRLSSFQRSTLLNLINYNSVLDIPKKRYNYLKLSLRQKKLLQKRLGIKKISYNDSFAKQFFYYLYR